MTYLINIVLILRSLWAGFFISVITILELPFGGIDRAGMNKRLYAWANSVLKLASVDVTIEGEENLQIEPGQRYVVMCNHASYYDIPLSMHAFQKHGAMRMIAKKELFQIPVWGWAMSHGEFIFIDRNDRHRAVQDIDRAKGLLETGVMFWIAPEGTRSPDGRLGQFKTGGVKLAMDMDAWIIPIGIEGAFDVLSKQSWIINRGRKVTVRIGKPIQTEGLARNKRKALTNEVREEIRTLAGLPADLLTEEPSKGAEESNA